MKNIIILILISFSLTHAQSWGGREMPEIGVLKGSVIDSLTNNPIEYASLSLISKRTNEVITGGVTDADGQFYIDKIKLGNYKVIIEFIGYKKNIINPIKLTFQDKFDKNIGIIKLKPSSIEMDAVNVIEDKPIYEFKTDKLVYNSSDDIVAGSGTAEDVLRKVPMVTVDQDGQVQLRGNSGVRLLVNGRPNRMGSDVDNIPASLIDKVEVITAPSAKYDPEGIAGIINIVLKKGEYEGLNGSIKFNAKHNRYNSLDDVNGFTLYGNYQTDKYNIYSSYSFNNRARYVAGDRYINRSYVSLNDSLPEDYGFNNSVTDFNFNDSSDRFGQSIKLGSDFFIKKDLTINSEFNFKKNYRESIDLLSYDTLFSNPTNLKLESKKEEDPGNYYLGGIFEIKKEFSEQDKKAILAIEMDTGKDKEISMFQNDQTQLDESSNGITIDFDYDLPLNSGQNLSFGYDGKFNNNSENMDFELTVSDTSKFSGVVDFKNDRKIHGVYAEYEHEINEKISVKPSIRYEYIDKNITFNKTVMDSANPATMVYAQLLYNQTNNNFENKYHSVYPDINLQYNITPKQSLQFSISKRVKRPDSGWGGPGKQTRPFPRDVYNQNFIFLGNPLLKPEYSTQYEFSYKRPIPMGFMTSSVFYHKMKNIIKWYDDNSYTGADVVTFRNADSGENYGINFFFLLMGQVIGGGYNMNIAEDPSNDYELNGKNERFNMYMRMTLPEQYIKIFDFEFGFYAMKLKVPGGTLFGKSGTIWANTGISKSFLDNKLDLSFSIDNIFNQGGFQMDRLSEYSPVGYPEINAMERTIVSTTRGGRTFAFNIKFNFGKMQEDKMKMRKGRGGRGGDSDMMEMY